MIFFACIKYLIGKYIEYFQIHWSAKTAFIFDLKSHLFSERLAIYEYEFFNNRRITRRKNVAAFKALRDDYGRHNRPTVQDIGKSRRGLIGSLLAY